LACEWAPWAWNVLAVGGVGTGLRLFDDRALEAGASSCLVFQNTTVSSHALRSVRFSPLVPHWCAVGGDDGLARVWDLRMGRAPVETLCGHSNIVRTVAWSGTHASLLTTASDDGTCKVWSLSSANPLRLVATVGDASSTGVIGADFLPHSLPGTPSAVCMFGADGSGGVLQLSDETLETAFQHRFPPGSAEVAVESLLFARKLEEGFEALIRIARSHIDEIGAGIRGADNKNAADKARALFPLVAACSAVGRDEDDEEDAAAMGKSGGKGFSPAVAPPPPFALSSDGAPDLAAHREFVLSAACLLPPLLRPESAVSCPDAAALSRADAHCVVLSVLHWSSRPDLKTLADLETKIHDQLAVDPTTFTVGTLVSLVRSVMELDMIRAIDLVLGISKVLRAGQQPEARVTQLLAPMAHMCLCPTVFEDPIEPGPGWPASAAAAAAGSSSSVPSGSPTLPPANPNAAAASASSSDAAAAAGGRSAKAMSLLSVHLKDPKTIGAHLKVTRGILMTLSQPEVDAQALVDANKDQTIILGGSVCRMYLHALAQLRYFDTFFIHAGEMLEIIKDLSPFGATIVAMLSDPGVRLLKQWCTEALTRDLAVPGETRELRKTLRVLTSILQSAPALPKDVIAAVVAVHTQVVNEVDRRFGEVQVGQVTQDAQRLLKQVDDLAPRDQKSRSGCDAQINNSRTMLQAHISSAA
jgi:hypothetical protein